MRSYTIQLSRKPCIRFGIESAEIFAIDFCRAARPKERNGNFRTSDIYVCTHALTLIRVAVQAEWLTTARKRLRMSGASFPQSRSYS